jgi:hypothetical protein
MAASFGKCRGFRLAFLNALALGAPVLLASACARPLALPRSPLYDFGEPRSSKGIGEQEARRTLIGHYAHFDIVTAGDDSTKTPMRTFVVSYGFTDFMERDGKILEIDRFVRASQMINQKGVKSSFSDEASSAIAPREQEVRLYEEGGVWRVYRPESPFLLGIAGDPSLPLSKDPKDPRLLDPTATAIPASACT